MFDWKLFPFTDFNKISLEWITDCLKAMVGGNQNQILSKKSDADFDFEWIDNTGGGGGIPSYNALPDKPSINGSTLQGNKTAAQLGLVGAEVGKQLSTNDYTNADKAKLDSIVFVTQSSTFADVNTAYTAGKKVIFFNNGELFDVVESPNANTYRFVHVTSGGGVRTAVITSGGNWTINTATNPGSYIKYTSQSLSNSQKEQARTNIGAVSTGDYNPDSKTTAQTQSVGVDNNGKLWTAPGGGGSSEVWELINDYTPAEDVNLIYINTDSNGNQFSLKKCLVLLDFQSSNTTANNQKMNIGFSKSGSGTDIDMTNCKDINVANVQHAWASCEMNGTFKKATWGHPNAANNTGYVNYNDGKDVSAFYVDSGTITSFAIRINTATITFDHTKTRLRIYGVRG